MNKYVGLTTDRNLSHRQVALPGVIGLILLLFVVSGSVSAEEFRRITPIATPRKSSTPLPPGAKAVRAITPVDPKLIETAVKDIMASWNTPQLGEKLSDNFYDKTRLLDSLSTTVPRDAKLRILSIQDMQTLSQYATPRGVGQADEIHSLVSVVVRTQIEFNDPIKGFQRLEGTNEYILHVRDSGGQR